MVAIKVDPQLDVMGPAVAEAAPSAHSFPHWGVWLLEHDCVIKPQGLAASLAQMPLANCIGLSSLPSGPELVLGEGSLWSYNCPNGQGTWRTSAEDQSLGTRLLLTSPLGS